MSSSVSATIYLKTPSSNYHLPYLILPLLSNNIDNDGGLHDHTSPGGNLQSILLIFCGFRALLSLLLLYSYVFGGTIFLLCFFLCVCVCGNLRQMSLSVCDCREKASEQSRQRYRDPDLLFSTIERILLFRFLLVKIAL